MIVSKPVKLEVEIEDLTTNCTYKYKGNSMQDCVEYFQSLFIGRRPYQIIHAKAL
ncbi:hypothetical protein PIL02S_03345 [Paenibacillus illinoisensis]|uniref:Uncharacterized protein n=1 Tax=Paenibacillus illinoisensis TaxID=59845 RepID=A0A2W0CC01_9BACL|nr:hypothetical protein PIL02S_03345 [Paenibacillus illinoisensis]